MWRSCPIGNASRCHQPAERFARVMELIAKSRKETTQIMNTDTIPQIVFHTNTEINPLSWEIIGMSAKETDNPIGMFGSGFKFALAILLRTGHQIHIVSEGTRYDFGTTPKEFRGKTFDVVTCNGKELGITTDMGRNWELWAAYRELVSNCMDEGGIHFAGEPLGHGTSIVVAGEDFAKLLHKHNDYFVGDREPLAESRGVKIYEGNGTLFYRGVKVGTLEHAGFSYEFTKTMDLTEDRTLRSEYAAHSDIMIAITQLRDRDVIRRILTMPKGKWEQDDDRDYDWSWSTEFSETVKSIWEVNPSALPKKVVRQVRKKLPDVEFRIIESSDYLMSIDKAKEFLHLAGYPVSAEIKVVENDDSNVVAFAHNGQIHLTERAFEKGLFDLVHTLFEEQMHILGHCDATRLFERYLIEQVITQARKRLKIVL